MLNKIKKEIERSVVALATAKNSKPHQIAVAAVKVIGSNVIITDNFMKETKSNIKSNKNVSLVFWSNKGGYELRGKANYFSSGKWVSYIKNLKENKAFKPKGAIVVKINKVKKLK